MSNTCRIWKLQAIEERFQLTPLQSASLFAVQHLKGWVTAPELFHWVFQQGNFFAIHPWGFCVCCGLRKGVPEGRAVQPVWCEEQQEAAPCVSSWIWLSDGWEACWALLMASLCFPSRVRLMTALIMPDGSHQSPFNSRKMPKYCLQNWFVHSFSLFQPGSDPQAALRDLLRRSRVENCQNRLLYGFSED